MCWERLQTKNEKLLKINSNGAAGLSRAAVRALSGLLSRGCRLFLIVQRSVTMGKPDFCLLQSICWWHVERAGEQSTTGTFLCSFFFELQKKKNNQKICHLISLYISVCVLVTSGGPAGTDQGDGRHHPGSQRLWPCPVRRLVQSGVQQRRRAVERISGWEAAEGQGNAAPDSTQTNCQHIYWD